MNSSRKPSQNKGVGQEKSGHRFLGLKEKEEEIDDLIHTQATTLTHDELEELVSSNSEDEDKVDEELCQEKKVDLKNLAQPISDATCLADFFCEHDDNMIHSMKFKESLDDILTPYTDTFSEFK
jgi:hypothetical protein